MVAQAAIAVELLGPGPPGFVRTVLQLACGCSVQQEVREDRILERADGSRFAVGKYSCPQGHAAGRPSR